jgi:hypothetical protein
MNLAKNLAYWHPYSPCSGGMDVTDGMLLEGAHKISKKKPWIAHERSE